MGEKNTIYIDMLQNTLNDSFFYVLENKLKENEYIVYKSDDIENEELIKEVNKIKPDLYVSLNIINNIPEGIKIYTNNKYTLGNEIAQKIYNQTKLIFNNQYNEKNIYYTNDIKELNEITIPSIYVELNYDNKEQERIVDTIYTGIDNYFKNRD